jgi:hypothetical protein
LGQPYGPRSPVPLADEIGVAGLLVGELLVERARLVGAIGFLTADIEANADRRVGIEVDDLVATHLADEFVRRQLGEGDLAVPRICRHELEAGRGQHVLLVHDLLRGIGTSRREQRQSEHRHDHVRSTHRILLRQGFILSDGSACAVTTVTVRP